ncbi:hypothetical protein HYY74_03170 [Candidatus Woesearchaeota archaeon]|nr:hypothetical protein [Candidatus Woesearchaeota archaeon]
MDASARKVTAEIPHFSLLALILSCEPDSNEEQIAQPCNDRICDLDKGCPEKRALYGNNLFSIAYKDRRMRQCCPMTAFDTEPDNYPRIYDDLFYDSRLAAYCEVIACSNNADNPQYIWVFTGREKREEAYLDGESSLCWAKKGQPGNIRFRNVFLETGCGLNV